MQPSPLSPSRNYQVYARRTRPQSMGELIGQPVVLRALSSVIASGQIPHAFLLTGTRGTGKTSTARILAKSLCCELGPTLTPCQVCSHCIQITASAHEDVLEIDGASNTGIDNIRELRESARFFPKTGRYKIFVIDEVHMLSTGAFNALLKTLEEPPPQVIFILATTELNKVPITVRSRCFPLVFRKIETDVIAAHLADILSQESQAAEPGALQLVAREARGSLRDGLSLLEQVVAFSGRTTLLTMSAVKEALALQGEQLAEQVFAAVCQRNAAGALAVLKEADSACLDIPTILDQTAGAFRQALLLRGIDDASMRARLVNGLPSEIEAIESHSKALSAAALSELFRLFSLAARDAARTSSPLAWAEVAVLDGVSRAEWLSATELLGHLTHQIQAGGNTGGGAGGSTSSGLGNNTSGTAGGGSPTGIQFSPSVPLTSIKMSAPAVGASTFIPTKASAAVSGLPAGPMAPAISAPKALVVAPATTAALSSKQGVIEIDAWSKFLTLLHGRHPGLSTRLKHAKILAFHAELLEFSSDPDNQLYAIASPSDAKMLQDTLADFGFPAARVMGLHTGGNDARKGPQRLRSGARTDGFSPTSLELGPVPKLDEILALDAFGQRPVSSTQREPTAPNPGQASLAQVERAQRSEELKRNEQNLRALDSVRRLATIAEIQFEPLDE